MCSPSPVSVSRSLSLVGSMDFILKTSDAKCVKCPESPCPSQERDCNCQALQSFIEIIDIIEHTGQYIKVACHRISKPQPKISKIPNYIVSIRIKSFKILPGLGNRLLKK